MMMIHDGQCRYTSDCPPTALCYHKGLLCTRWNFEPLAPGELNGYWMQVAFDSVDRVQVPHLLTGVGVNGDG